MVMLLSLLLLALLPKVVWAQPSDAELLLLLKSSFDNGEEALPGWQPGTDCCAWASVTCTNGQVTKL